MNIQASTVVEKALFAGLFSSCLGSYFGNVFISVGHGLFVIAIVVQLVLSYRRGRVGGRNVELGGAIWRWPRWSTAFLILVAAAIVVSILVNLNDIKEPFCVLKKLRYHLIWACLLLMPDLMVLISRKITDWVPWLLLAWLISLSFATLSGMVGVLTGYNPLLLAPASYPTRVSGVYAMVMTYAYSVQFSVLLLVGLFVAGRDVRNWLFQGYRWLKLVAVTSLILAVLGLYFSYTRGALAGAIGGGLCLVAIYRRRSLLIGLASLTILAAAFAMVEKSRYVSRGVEGRFRSSQSVEGRMADVHKTSLFWPGLSATRAEVRGLKNQIRHTQGPQEGCQRKDGPCLFFRARPQRLP